MLALNLVLGVIEVARLVVDLSEKYEVPRLCKEFVESRKSKKESVEKS